MIPDVDLVVLTRDESPLPSEVERAIRGQRRVRPRLHRVIGRPRAADTCRQETIARARNEGRLLGTAPWLMFVDDDVVLHPDCARQLVDELRRRPGFAAFAADYLGESPFGEPTNHVAMGATLFRRSALEQIHFRFETNSCECRCCCGDLRRQAMGIAYCVGAHARHIRLTPRDANCAHTESARPHQQPAIRHSAVSTHTSGRVLAAFNRHHFRLFRGRFLRSLRESGNDEQVTAVAYGLRPGQRRMLAGMKRVDVEPLPYSDSPPILRVRDFQRIVAGLPGDSPVAYWDAGDVYFQGKLAPLWELVQQHPDRLLVAREPYQHPENTAVAYWTQSIAHPAARQAAFDLLSRRPFLNSGFVAATAQAMLLYLREAERLMRSSALAGTTDFGDQTALNLYCHNNPQVWHEVKDSWNYCLCGRAEGEVRLGPDSRFVSRRGTAIHVVHGNARTLAPLPVWPPQLRSPLAAAI